MARTKSRSDPGLLPFPVIYDDCAAGSWLLQKMRFAGDFKAFCDGCILAGYRVRICGFGDIPLISRIDGLSSLALYISEAASGCSFPRGDREWYEWLGQVVTVKGIVKQK